MTPDLQTDLPTSPLPSEEPRPSEAPQGVRFSVASSVTAGRGPQVHLRFQKPDAKPFGLNLTPDQARFLAAELLSGAETSTCMKGFYDALTNPDLRDERMPAAWIQKVLLAMSESRRKHSEGGPQ